MLHGFESMVNETPWYKCDAHEREAANKVEHPCIFPSWKG